MEKFKKGDKIQCLSNRDLKAIACKLSSLGYGVAVIGLSDICDNILTITEEPDYLERIEKKYSEPQAESEE